MKIYNFEQGTPERFEARKLKMTASNATAIGNCGKGLDTYIFSMVAEHFSSGEKDRYKSYDMDRGNELEPIARDMYELTHDVKVQEVGFVEYDEFIGCSPDGLVGEDGGIEIKCLNDEKHFELILDGEKRIASGYIRQIQMCLLITGRKRRDYVSYNPNFKKSLIVHRIYPDLNKFEKLLAGFEYGKEKINELIEKYNKAL